MQRVEMMIGPRDFANLKAEQFMQDVVSYYQVNDLANKLAGAITEGGFGSVPILSDDGKVVGIVSEFDLLQAISEGKDLAQITAGEIMTRGMSPSPGIRERERLFSYYRIIISSGSP